MTTLGWILLLASWLTIISIFVYCMIRVLTTHRADNGEGHMLGGAEEPPHD